MGRITSGIAVGFVTGLTIAAPAWAQADSATQAINPDIADIVVTATRREERLQNVPVSITALTGTALTDRGITSTSQLTQVTPGLTLSRSGAITQPSIRGVGSRAAVVGDESNIAIYVDGVYQPSPYTSIFDLVEVDRIEVLRGPQGTLFGRNSTGGLINVITPDPAFTPKANLTLRYGRFDEVSVRGYVSAPLTDKIAFDVAGLYYDDNGYVKNPLTGQRLADRTNYSGRGKLLFKPSDRVRITLAASYLHSDDNSSVAYVPVAGNTVGKRTPGAFIPTDPFDSVLSFTPFVKIRQYSASLKSIVDFDPFTVEVTTAYQSDKMDNLTDTDASVVDVSSVHTFQTNKVATQEIRLISNGSNRFKWTVGAFGFLGTSRYDPIIILGANSIASFSLFSRNRTTSAAAFAEGTYALTDALKLTLGGRYSWERRHFTATRQPTVVGSPLDRHATFRQFTPRASLQLRLVDNVNAYLSYSRGFKSGVFNAIGLNPVPVKPETITAYEFGIKAEPLPWLRTNLSIFYYDYKDIQVTVRDPTNGLTQLQNAAQASIVGGELEATVAATRDLSFSFGLSLLDAQYGNFPNAVFTTPTGTGGNTTSTGNARNKYIYRSPNATINAGFNYHHAFDFGAAGVSGNLYRSAHFYWDLANRLAQPAYTLANGQIWVEPRADLRISLWGENLTNAVVTQNVQSTTTADYATYLRPRSYGVALRIKI